MNKIIVFGATGGTGKLVVEHALAAGLHVSAVVRNPAALGMRHKNLEVIQGDVLQPSSFEYAFKGCNAVVSCLGVQKREPTSVYSEGVRNILTVMERENIHRIVCLSAAAVIVPPKSSFIVKFIARNILQRLLKHSFADILRMEALLRGSAMDWTVIRPPRLTHSSLTGKYRVAVDDHLRNLSKISRADLAHYIVHHLSDEKTYRALVEISY